MIDNYLVSYHGIIYAKCKLNSLLVRTLEDNKCSSDTLKQVLNAVKAKFRPIFLDINNSCERGASPCEEHRALKPISDRGQLGEFKSLDAPCDALEPKIYIKAIYF